MSEIEEQIDNSIFQSTEKKQQLNSLSNEVGFEIPVESVTLPSKGLVYSLDHPLSNETSVDIKCMTAKEEDLLTSSGLIKNGTVISKLLQSCILNKTINSDSLLLGDRNAILIAIRITGYGAEYENKVTCNICEEDFENEFNLSKLNIKPLGATPLTANTNLFDFTLPVTQKQVTFKLLTGMDDSEISQIEKKNKKIGRQVESGVTSRLLHSVVSINGDTDRNKIAKQILNMPARDSRALRNYIDKIEPGVDMKQWVACSKCGEETEVKVLLGTNFFWPDIV